MKVEWQHWGFSTNSSSSHSILLLHPNDSAQNIPENWEDCGEYGWQNFTLTTKESKLHYLGTFLVTVFHQDYTDVERFFKKNYDYDFRSDPNDYIDHQSTDIISSAVAATDSSLKEFVDFILSDRIVILGGNDNSEGHPLREYGIVLSDVVDLSEYLG